METAVTLLFIVVIVLCIILCVALFRLKASGGGATSTVQGTLERIREVGDLCVLKAHVKEIVTLKTDPRWHTSDGKMALICSFEIEFRYDLRTVQIEQIGVERSFRLTIPPHFCKVIPDKIAFYHEEKPKRLAVWPMDFTVEERNKMIHDARAAATAQAEELHESIESKVQASAEATLRAIATAFGASHVEVKFVRPESAIAQIREGMQKLAA